LLSFAEKGDGLFIYWVQFQKQNVFNWAIFSASSLSFCSTVSN